MTKVWLYARRRNEEECRQLLQVLQQLAAEQGMQVVGSSADSSYGKLSRRPGLWKLMGSIWREKADAVLVSTLSDISHKNRQLLGLLKLMQAHRVRLYTVHTQLAYELYGRGLEAPLRRRAVRFDGFLPYSEGKQSAGSCKKGAPQKGPKKHFAFTALFVLPNFIKNHFFMGESCILSPCMLYC